MRNWGIAFYRLTPAISYFLAVWVSLQKSTRGCINRSRSPESRRFRSIRYWYIFLTVAIIFVTVEGILVPTIAQVTYPPNSPDDVPIAQIFSSRLPQPAALPSEIKFIWGALNPVHGVYSTAYIPFDRNPLRAESPSWYLQNAPQQIIRKCDGETPAFSHRYSWGDLTPLDISNDDVAEAQMKCCILPALKRGYQGIAFDNVTTTNLFHRCGVRREGEFHKLYSGEELDERYFNAVSLWIKKTRQELHALGLSMSINLHYDSRRPDWFAAAAREADVILEEQGFARRCLRRPTGVEWSTKIETLSSVAQTRSLILVNQACSRYESIERSMLEWVIANYLLIRGTSTYLAVTGEQEYGTLLNPVKLRADVGSPISRLLDGETELIKYRHYEKGLVIVNGDPSRRYTFKLDHIYKDMNGQFVPFEVNMEPVSAAILMRDQ